MKYLNTQNNRLRRSANPYCGLSLFGNEMEKAFFDFSNLFELESDTAGSANRANRLATDVYENEDAFLLRTELPGFAKEELSIELEGDALVISASKKPEDADGKAVEKTVASRSYTLPETVDAEKIAAAYENGILEVTLPKKEKAKPKRISING